MAVSILDTMTAYASAPATIAVSAGSDRMLLVSSNAVADSAATGMTVGTVAGTLLDEATGTGWDVSTSVFFWDEADIAAMSGSTFSVTAPGPGTPGYMSIALADAEQVTPVYAVGAIAAASGATSLVRVADSVSIVMQSIDIDNTWSATANPTHSATVAYNGNRRLGGGAATDTARTADFTWSNGFNRDNAYLVINVATAAASGAVMTISEAIAAADTYASRLSALFTVAETTAITDAEAGKLSTSMTVSESASSSDSEGAQAAMNATISEALVAADLLSGVIVPGGSAVIMTVSEAVASADNVSFSANFTMSISESATALDSISSRAALVASIAEAVSAIDTVVAFSPTAYSLTMSESVNIADLFNLAGDAGIITATITITQILSANILDEQLINGEVTDKPLIDGDITEIPVISGTITVS